MRYLFSMMFLSYFAISCDPPRDIYQEGIIKIDAKVVNPRTTINVGDSVGFHFEVPDTVTLDGRKIKVILTPSDGGNNGFYACRIDSSRPGGFTNAPSRNSTLLYAKNGSITSSGTWNFSYINGKLVGDFFMIPQEKGVYFFEQSQLGYVDLNNKSLKLRFSYDFGLINRNHQMLIDSAGVSNKFGLFLQGKSAMNLEVYGFKVQ